MASTTTPDAPAVSVPTYVRPRSYRAAPGGTQERSAAARSASGRRAALEAFYGDMFTLEGDAAAVMDRVLAGSAPQEFKDAFVQTLTALSAMFDEKI